MRRILILAVTCTSCAPAISHAPRVEPGPSAGFTAGYAVGPRYYEAEFGDLPFLFAPVGVDFGYGWVRSDSVAAFRAGAHIPFPFAQLVQADGYAQAPQRWLGDFDVGAGVSASIVHIMPYAQLGRLSAEATGWYTTQGVNFVFGGDENYGVLWMPGLAYQWRRPTSTTRLFATAGFGHVSESCHGSVGCDPAEPRQFFSLGMSFELHRRAQQPPPP